MEPSCLFSILSLEAVFIFIYIGIYALSQNKKSYIYKIFFILCMSYSVWAFAYAFVYAADYEHIFSFCYKIAAIGWSGISALLLYLALLVTENKILKHKIIKFLIFIPAGISLYTVFFVFKQGADVSKLTIKIFHIANLLYDVIYLLIGILVVFIWGYKSKNIRVKKQSKIILAASIISFLLNYLTRGIANITGTKNFPFVGHLYAVIFMIGAYIIISKYNFLIFPEKYIYEQVANKIMDIVIILNDKGEFIKISKHSLEILGYEEKELFYKDIRKIFENKDKELFSIQNIKNKKEYTDMILLKKNGDKIPVNVSCVPVYDTKIHDFLGAAIVIHDISIVYELKKKNKELQEKAVRDGLTKLYNHQYCMEIINKEVDKVKAGCEKELTLLMIDVDYFKNVNDNYGHQFGDYVLEIVSGILAKHTCDKGYAGRFGGEEFVIIFPRTEINDAYIIAQNIINEIQRYKFKKSLKLTVSIGIKQLENESSMEFVKNADDLLYKAKQNGRNRIELSS